MSAEPYVARSHPADLALVLSGGGARAAYQVGVLSAIAEQAPELSISILTGVSAGAINTMYLAAHPGPFRDAVAGLRREWRTLTPDRVYRVRPVRLGSAALRWVLQMALRRRGSPSTVRGLMDMRPLRAFLDRCIRFGDIDANIRAGRLRAVALSATCYDSGKTVTFVQGAPDVEMWERHMRFATRAAITLDHLMASAAIPIIFPAVKLDGGFYGDGSVRQTAPLAPAIHLGARRVLAVAMRAGRPAPACAPESSDYPAAAQVMGTLLHSVFLDSLEADAERLDRVNELLRAIAPGTRPRGLRPVDLLMLRPSRDLASLARGMDVELPRMVRMALQGVGGEREQSADFLSYLLFQPNYISTVMQLGYEDTREQWPLVNAFLDRWDAERSGRAVGR